MYLVDTNVVSEARRRAPVAVAWLMSVPRDSVYLSVITLGEVMRGIALKQRTDPAAAASLSDWLRSLRHEHADRILPVSDAVAVEWGRLSATRPRGDADGLIAASCIVHDLVLVTRNVADFDDLPMRIIDPWRAA